MKSIDDTLHVFDSHVAHKIIDLTDHPEEFNEYSKEELVEIIKIAGEASKDFIDNWLTPILDELEEFRGKRL